MNTSFALSYQYWFCPTTAVIFVFSFSACNRYPFLFIAYVCRVVLAAFPFGSLCISLHYSEHMFVQRDHCLLRILRAININIVLVCATTAAAIFFGSRVVFARAIGACSSSARTKLFFLQPFLSDFLHHIIHNT